MTLVELLSGEIAEWYDLKSAYGDIQMAITTIRDIITKANHNNLLSDDEANALRLQIKESE